MVVINGDLPWKACKKSPNKKKQIQVLQIGLGFLWDSPYEYNLGDVFQVVIPFFFVQLSVWQTLIYIQRNC